MDLVSSGRVFPHFQRLSGYGLKPYFFICPFEKERQAATDYDSLTDLNLSYFLNADSSLSNNPTASILVGDRCLRANGHPVQPGLFLLRPNEDLSWTPGCHANRGNLAFADGHAEFPRAIDLNSIVQHQPLKTNRFLVP
jgi:prepilin-type processing-associated H-X9-DG protein